MTLVPAGGDWVGEAGRGGGLFCFLIHSIASEGWNKKIYVRVKKKKGRPIQITRTYAKYLKNRRGTKKLPETVSHPVHTFINICVCVIYGTYMRRVCTIRIFQMVVSTASCQ